LNRWIIWSLLLQRRILILRRPRYEACRFLVLGGTIKTLEKIKIETVLKFYKAVIVLMLVYGSKYWTHNYKPAKINRSSRNEVSLTCSGL
jgi:hypothetical protein